MTLNLDALLEKKVQHKNKKEGDKKHLKEPLRLKIFILEKIEEKNRQLY
jgi:hypothetical protein